MNEELEKILKGTCMKCGTRIDHYDSRWYRSDKAHMMTCPRCEPPVDTWAEYKKVDGHYKRIKEGWMYWTDG
tara:strand:+ start:974 stop:1189 length:216 start_codon:yes stop_codon:yes gene_type:complete